MADPLVSFTEAVAAIRARIVLTDAEYTALVAVSSDWAFWAAGLAQVRMVQDVLDSLTQAVEKGLGLDEWRRGLPAMMRSAWGRGSAWRLETIFRNAVQHAYSRGRYRQMTNPAVLRFRPYWLYDAVRDRQTSPICRERDRTVLPATDPWWQSNYPQLHHNCRSGVRTLRESQALRMGVTDTSTIRSQPQTGFGQAPAGPPVKQTDMTHVDPALQASFQDKQNGR